MKQTAAAIVLLAMVGCGQRPPSNPDSGARAMADQFLGGLIHQNWQAMYDALHPDIRVQISSDEFMQRAQAYRRNLGFEPEAFFVRASSEQGERASIHVVLAGKIPGAGKQFKEGLTLRKSPTGWGVVPGERFGQARRR